MAGEEKVKEGERVPSVSDKLFDKFAHIATNFTLVTFLIGSTLAVAFSLGLLVSKIETDVDTLWVDLDSRLIGEKGEFEKVFGGTPRQIASVVSANSSAGNVFSSQSFVQVHNYSNGLAALENSMQIWADLKVTFRGQEFGAGDLCERPVVPADLRPGGLGASMYADYTQCMATHQIYAEAIYPLFRYGFQQLPGTYTPLHEGWGIQRFPCNRASALDCFREGEEVDWPESLRLLNRVSPALATTARAIDTYVSFKESVERTEVPGLGLTFKQFSESNYPCWLFHHSASIACLSGAQAGSQKISASVQLLALVLLVDTNGAGPVPTLFRSLTSGLNGASTPAAVQPLVSTFRSGLLLELKKISTPESPATPILAYAALGDFVQLNATEANLTIGRQCLASSVARALAVPVAGVAGDPRSPPLLTQLENTVLQLSSFGFWHRPSYRTMHEAGLVAYFNRAANNEINPAVRDNAAFCFEAPGRACCNTWNGAVVSTAIFVSGPRTAKRRPVPGTGFASIEYEHVGSLRAGLENYHHLNPAWQEQLEASHPNISWSIPAVREELARKFDQALIARWLRLYKRVKGSGYATGERMSAFRHDFSTAESLRAVLDDASKVENHIVGLSYGIMAVLIVLAMGNVARAVRGGGVNVRQELVDSHGLLGLQGLAVIALSSTAGIGLASYLQITLNGLSINLVPFVSLGLGIDDMFVLSGTMAGRFDRSRDLADNVADTLRAAGPSVCLTSLANAAAFVLVCYVPVGAVRQLVLVLFIAVLVNLLLLFLLFVPLMVWDLRRRLDNRMDFAYVKVSDADGKTDGVATDRCDALVDTFVDKYYAPLLANKTAKAVILTAFLVFSTVTLWSALARTEDGLPASDIALRDTYQRDIALLSENQFVQQPCSLVSVARRQRFSKPKAQAQLIRTVESLQRSPWIIPGIRVGDVNWLTNSTTSLLSTYAFVQPSGLLGQCPAGNASAAIRNETCFASYYRQWFANAGIGYSPYLSCRNASHRVPCTAENSTVTATRTSFYLDSLHKHTDFLDAIRDVRSRIDPNSDADVKSFAVGHIFYFWEQYFGIRTTLIAAIGLGLLGVFFVTFAMQRKPALSLVVCAVVVLVEVQLTGLLPAMGVRFNPLSVANLVIGVGMAVEFSAHYARAFLLADGGTRDERTAAALREMMPPMVSGALSTIVALSVLALARFPFFRRYYALMFVAMVLVAFLNGLLLLPVLLSVVGPAAGPGRKANAPGPVAELSTSEKSSLEKKLSGATTFVSI